MIGKEGVKDFVTQFFASGGEVELMRGGDFYPTGISYGVASYFKMARRDSPST